MFHNKRCGKSKANIEFTKKGLFSEIYYLVVLSIIIQVASQKHLEMYRISEERGDFYFSRKLHFEDCILGTYYLVVFHISDGK